MKLVSAVLQAQPRRFQLLSFDRSETSKQVVRLESFCIGWPKSAQEPVIVLAFRYEKKLRLPREYIGLGFTPMQGGNLDRIEASQPWRYVSGIGELQSRWMWKGKGGAKKKLFRECKGYVSENGSVVEATTCM